MEVKVHNGCITFAQTPQRYEAWNRLKAVLAAKSIKDITSARFVFIVALAVRLVFGVATVISGVDIFTGNEPSHIAAHLAKGEGFSSPYDAVPIAPTAQQPPVYPVLLAMIFKFLGVYSRAALAAIVALNAVAGAAIAALIYLVGRQYFSSTAAIVSAWAWVGWSEFAANRFHLLTLRRGF